MFTVALFQFNSMSLSLLQPKHIAELYALVVVSRHGLTNLEWSKTATFESTAQFVHSQNSSHKLFGVYTKDYNLAGCLSLRLQEDQSSSSLLLGYWLGTPYRGRGLMDKAVGLMLYEYHKYFTVQEIQARIRKENEKSIRIVENAGFKKWGEYQDEKYDWVLMSWNGHKY